MFVLNYNYCNISGVLFKAFFLLSTQHHIPFRLRFSDIENYVLQLFLKVTCKYSNNSLILSMVPHVTNTTTS